MGNEGLRGWAADALAGVPAPGEAGQQISESQALLDRLGMSDMAGFVITAHGKDMTVLEGLESCPPFAQQFKGTAESLEKVASMSDEDRRQVLTDTIRSNAAEVRATSVTDAKKK